MGYFVIVIFVLVCMTQPGCFEGAYPGFHKCLNKWRIVREWRGVPSAFLTDHTLVEEICKTGVSVGEMHKCVKQNVDVSADNVLAYWSGIRDKYSHICTYYNEFIRYRRCRTNPYVVNAYDMCPHEYPGKECWDFKARMTCVKRALRKHCKGLAVQFFSNLIDTELYPLFNYMGCSIDTPQTNFPAMGTTTSVQPESTSELVRQEINRQIEIEEDKGRIIVPQTNLPTTQVQPEPTSEILRQQIYRETMVEADSGRVILDTQFVEENLRLYSSSSRVSLRVWTLLLSCALNLLWSAIQFESN